MIRPEKNSMSTRKMSAALSHGPDSPFALQTVEIEEPRADEILVRIVATGLCHTDLFTKSALPKKTRPLRVRPRRCGNRRGRRLVDHPYLRRRSRAAELSELRSVPSMPKWASGVLRTLTSTQQLRCAHRRFGADHPERHSDQVRVLRSVEFRAIRHHHSRQHRRR